MNGFSHMNNKKTVISLQNVSKIYKLPMKTEGEFYAIKNLSMRVKKGEKIGIVGDNGAGKTTLLKLISKVTKPTEGKINVGGRITSLINLEAGFNEELTGRENIILNGMIYGLTKKEVMRVFDKIIEFADIGRFIDAPFFVYSSGMKFRLALSVALATEPEIILMDEIFMAGDIDFQIKTLKKIEEIAKNKQMTFMMASHYPLVLRKYCDRFILLKNGKLINSSKKTILGLTRRWNDYFNDVPKIKIENDLLRDPYYQR
jgi:lipopolysaccharide transport system ATP-binding protein